MADMFEDALIDDSNSELTFMESPKDDLPIPTITREDKKEEIDRGVELKFPVFNEDESKIYCQVCGKLYKSITQSHLKFHDITPAQYKEMYNTPLFTESQLNRLSVVNKDKYKHLMKDQENKLPQEELDEIIIEEVNISDIVDKMEEISFDQNIEDIKDVKVKVDPSYTKTELAYNIEETIGNVIAKENYFIEESSGSGAFPGTIHLKYSFITDIAIPERKIAFFFPDTYWHNREVAVDPNKYKKLAEDGWKCIVINGNNPNMNQIIEELRKSNII